MSIIEVNHVVKEYRLGQIHSLRESIKRLKGVKSAKPRNTLHALDDVHFSVNAGEVLGIIGSNGAGKSTLLKVLSGITTPTSGSMVARGRVAPLIEVGAGLIADLTGRENIFLNGVILGMSIKEIKQKFDEIVAFSELEQFIDTPIKRYSSGMAVRLGFAIATAVECQILIVDEVLAVGDIAFQRKCFDRIEDIIKNKGTTVLLVSHNIRQVERLCTRAILLDHGRVVADGETNFVCRQFFEQMNAKIKATQSAAPRRHSPGMTCDAWSDVRLLGLDVLNTDGRATDVVPFRKDILIEVRFRARVPLRDPVFGLGVHTSDLLYLATDHSDLQLSQETLPEGDYTLRCVFRRPPIMPGVYSVRFGISAGVASAPAFYEENLAHFQVTAEGAAEPIPTYREGFFALDAEWQEPSCTTRLAERLATA